MKPNMATTIFLTVMVTLAIGAAIFNLTWFNNHMIEYRNLKSNKEYIDTTYLQKQGSTTMFGDKGFDNPVLNYDLRSWDGGKNWYVVDYNFETKEVKVLGEVESIYPGLLEHLESWYKLTDHVSKNGPLNPLDSTDKTIMEDAGFTVKDH